MREPREGAFAKHVEGAARLTEPAHAMLDPPRPQPLLGDAKALALLAEQIAERDTGLVEANLAVVVHLPRLRLRVVHGPDVAQHLHAGSSLVDEQHRGTVERRRLGIRHGHHDEEVGDRRVGRVPLEAVEHPLGAVPDGGRLQQRGIGAGTVLRHREAGAQAALQ